MSKCCVLRNRQQVTTVQWWLLFLKWCAVGWLGFNLFNRYACQLVCPLPAEYDALDLKAAALI